MIDFLSFCVCLSPYGNQRLFPIEDLANPLLRATVTTPMETVVSDYLERGIYD